MRGELHKLRLMPYLPEVKDAARKLYLRRYKPREIQAQLKLPNARIVYYWIAKGRWDELLTDEEPLTAVSRRITLILERVETLEKKELDELDRLLSVRERLQKQAVKPAPGTVADLPAGGEGERRAPGDKSNRRDADSQGKKKTKAPKNDISHLTEVDFLDKFTSKLFGYQKELFEAKQNPLTRRIRNVLKARQTGLTYYFAGEAFMDAVLTGDNQMFLSASRAQSEIFRNYIIKFAREWFGLELTGNPIILSNGAELRFLSTNSSTAQGHHGHVYVDEYFWIRDFDKLNTLSGAMATHKKWRKTYFSTPSAVSHQAYPFWTGDAFKRGKHKKASLPFPSEAELRQGALCPDGQWRKIITIHDAIAGGCDLFDLEQLQLENSDDQFDQLYLCKFIDSTQSAFALAIWSAAIRIACCGPITTPTRRRYGHSPIARYGWATTPAAPATTPLAWWSHRPWSKAASSASWRSTLGAGTHSPTRRRRSRRSPSASTSNTLASTSPVWATACSTWCAISSHA